MRESKVILAKGINLDNTYSNVLDYTEQNMLDLLLNESHVTYQANNYQFIREQENQISVQIPYDVCLQSNYMAFQNKDYSNKWFFAFITDVKFTSEKATTITYEIDVFSTWFKSITVTPSFVEREHVNDDTKGLHTIPENLETGEYICNEEISLNDASSSNIIIQAIYDASSPNKNYQYGGVFSGTLYMIMDIPNAISYLKYMDRVGKKDYVVSIFMYKGDVKSSETYQIIDEGGTIECTFNLVDPTSLATTENFVILSSKPNSLGSYTPKNKKLLTYPYCYLLADNGVGCTKAYKYEDFGQDGCTFARYSTVTIGGSVYYAPRNYKWTSASESSANLTEGFAGAKFPVCSWTSDSYINWLTQNSVNEKYSYGKDAIQTAIGSLITAGGLATGNMAITLMGGSMMASGIGSGISDVTSNMQAREQHQIAPMELMGNASLGDVLYALNRSLPIFYKMSIKPEYARSLDDYFSRFGYKINRVKTPNITGRTYWNFVKIGAGEDIGNGNMPNKFKDVLNQIFRNGTTIWHSHDNIGNFNLNNTIVS